MVRELTGFPSTTIRIKLASCDVEPVALVSTCAGPLFPVPTCSNIWLARGARTGKCFCSRRSVRFLWGARSFSPFSSAFPAWAGGPFCWTDNRVGIGALVAPGASSHFSHLSAGVLLFVDVSNRGCGQPWLVGSQGSLVLFMLHILKVELDHGL